MNSAVSWASAGLFRLQNLWLSQSFERRLKLVLCTIFLCGLSVAATAFWKSQQSDYLLERSRLAHKVLQSYLNLSGLTHEFHQVVGRRLINERNGAASAGLGAEDQLIAGIAQNIADLRRLIAEEISFVGSAPNEDEKEEFERLAKIERRITTFIAEYDRLRVKPPGVTSVQEWQGIAQALDRLLDTEFRNEISEGIEDERKEVATSDEQAKRLIVASRRIILLASLLALLMTTLGVVVLARNVRGPMAALQQAMREFSTGNYAHRAKAIGDDEFGRLIGKFNEMAAELEKRSTLAARTQTDLERKVQERTRNLADLNASLSASDQARRRFLSDLSHELRTPLTIIRGESEIMLRAKDAQESEYKAALERILEQAKHTAVLVDDLLFIARKESGEQRLKLQPVDFAALVKQVCAEVKPLGVEKAVDLVCACEAPALPYVLGDPARLKQVALVIFDNALRYVRRNGHVHVSLHPTPDGIALVVTDDGIGIPADDLPFVFERFYRGSNAVSSSSDGVGLGLPVAKAIVEAHGGTVTIESDADRGTTVTVTLPSAQPPGQPRLRSIA